jgi:hypothetical protein
MLAPRTRATLTQLAAISTLFASLLACDFERADRIDAYMAEYGGSEFIYWSLLREDNCETLVFGYRMDEAGLELEEPGSPEYQENLGYMAATEYRMREIGC